MILYRRIPVLSFVFGGIFLFVGVFAILNASFISAFVFIILASIIFTIKEGVEFDLENKQVRDFTQVFFGKFGHYKRIKTPIFLNTVSISLGRNYQSRFGQTVETKEKTYKLVVLLETNKMFSLKYGKLEQLEKTKHEIEQFYETNLTLVQ